VTERLLVLETSWSAIEAALALVAESGSGVPSANDLARLRGLGLVGGIGRQGSSMKTR